MSWEEISRKRYPCPCGKGEYEEIDSEDDWFQHQTSRKMFCPDCKERYTYDSHVVAGHPGDEVERGWVLKNVLEAEETYQKRVMALVREHYYEKWRERFANARTKKQIWEILTANGKYYPSLGTFYRHTKGYDRRHLEQYIDQTLGSFHDLGQILDICSVEPNWEVLGVKTETLVNFARLRCGGEVMSAMNGYVHNADTDDSFSQEMRPYSVSLSLHRCQN